MAEPVKYIDRTRDYYLSQGYAKPYQWAHFDQIPFSRLAKPLSECRATLISTSDVAIRNPDGEGRDKRHEDLVGSAYVIPTETPEELLFSRQEHYDQHATHLDDVNSYFPISRLKEQVALGRLQSLAPRCHGVYTAYSQKRTLEVDAPEVLRRCREDEVDIAVLTPVWPVCHQTVSLVARHLEANGIPTVMIATAKDIVQNCGVPRLLFVDFPLGNPCGVPFDINMQSDILEAALGLLETAEQSGDTTVAPYVWPEGEAWKETIFTSEQPFLEGEAYDNWMAAKQRYRKQKKEER